MSTLPLYWKLSSSSKNERLGASVELISALEQFQEQHVPPSEGTNSEDSEEEDADQLMASLETLNSEDVRYAIKRLIRGLGSPKESSRLGFAVVLTELLSRLRTITAKQIIQLVIENSQTAGSMKGQEIRDMLFARLFGMTSVIQSNLLFRTEPIPNSDSPPALLSDFSTVITELISVGEKKSWLRESAWWSILLAVESLYTSQVEWKAEASQLTISRLFSNLKDVTSETIALALKMQPLFPALDWKAVLVPAFKNGNILSPDSLRILARVFRDAPSLDDDNEDIKHHNVGHWNPQLHFVWDIIFTRYLDPSLQAYNLPDTSTIFDFYRVVVDESLFSSTSSPERKSWGFQVVQKLLGRIPNADIPLLFTQNFMRSWTNHLSGKDRYLHKEAVKVASAIQSVAASNPNVGYTLLLTLVGKDHKQFDNLTKTKTIESILTALDVQGVQGYVDYLIKKAAEATQDSDPMSTTRNHTWVADQLVTLIRSASVPNNDEWIAMALQFLLLHSFFVVKKRDGKSPIKALQVAGKVGLTEDGHGIIRIRLYSTLAHLIGNHHSLVGLEAFEQCDKAIRRLFPLSTSKKPSKKKKHQSPEADDEDEDLEPIDIVIDVLIGCMEDNEASTSFTRETADIVLGLMSGELKQSSIDLLTTQLVPRDPLADEEEEEEELSGEELEAMEVASSESESSDDQSDAEDGHEDDTEDTGDEEVDPELRKRIAQALNAQGMTEAEMEDGNVGGTGEESEEEILMDDDQMMALDEKLADIFRSTNKAMKKKRQDAQRAANVFRGRILDLIETFIKRQPASKFIIHFIQPLLEVAINSSPEEQHLSGKASKLLQNRISQLKEPIPDLDVEKASELLQELHEWAKRAK
ncbi:DNA-directed DNA polymerase, partial [Tulasnella sp. 418]